MNDILTLLQDHIVNPLYLTYLELRWAVLIMVGITLVANRKHVWAYASRAWPEIRFNASIILIGAIFLAPIVAMMATAIPQLAADLRLRIFTPEDWEFLSIPLLAILVIFIQELIAYWRHRAMHSRLLWPIHAFHHSDREVNLLTLYRHHPIERIYILFLEITPAAILGFPAEAVIFAVLVRSFYALTNHIDPHWTFGEWGKILVSPAYHRWHHALDPKFANANFGNTVTFYDRIFGTYAPRGRCDVPTGVTENMGRGLPGQLIHPFKVWFGSWVGSGKRAPKSGD